MPTLHELGQKYDLALNTYKQKLDSFPMKKQADGSEQPDIPSTEFKALQDMLGEVEATGKEFNDARKHDEASKRHLSAHEELSKGNRGGAPVSGAAADGTVQKSLGQLFTESKSIRDGRILKDVEATLDIDVKTLMQTGTGWAPQTVRSGRVVMSAQRPPQVMDLIPSGTISQTANKYMRETTYTNAAAETAEAGAFPEAALALQEVSDVVQKVAVFLPVTDEQLEDIDGIRSYIDNRLELMLRQRVDSQIMNGNGTSPNLKGYLNIAGIQTVANATAGSGAAAIKGWLKLITQLRDIPGFCNPSDLIMNPVDWSTLVTAVDANGRYLLGDPGSKASMELWSLPITMTSVLAQGTGFAADFPAYTELLWYKGVEIIVTNSNNDDFYKGRQCIRGTVRLVNTCYRSTAMGTVTGL